MGNLKIGEILYVNDGKKGNGVSHDKGKIVLFRNKVKRGYAKITKVLKEADNYYLAEGENIPYDYYDGMSYAEFKEMLVARGYKIGYEQPFYNKQHPELEQKHIFAYNMTNGIIIIAETYHEVEDDGMFNSIDVYVPNMMSKYAGMGYHGYQYNLSAFNIYTDPGYRDSFSLETLEKIQKMKGGNNQWLENILPHMWHYEEIETMKNPYRTLKLREGRECIHFTLQTAMKFNLINKEIRELFKDNKTAQDIFAMIDAMNEKGVDYCEVKAADDGEGYDKDFETIYLYK